MTDVAPASARQDAYIQWRQRLADKQAARRQPEEAPAAKRNSQWDPEALFRADEPSRPAPDEGASPEPTIDLRDAAPPPVTAEPLDSQALARPRHEVQPLRGPEPSCARPDAAARPTAPRRDLRKERFDSVMARIQDSTTAPEAPTTEAGDVEARHGHPQSTTDEPTPISESLRELNQYRLEGIITDEEFKARKAALFGRASRP
jgi:hypothetical protein